MKVYVAAKWEEKEAARRAQRELRSLGHSITFDWTTGDGKNQESEAKSDLQGVELADAVIVLNHDRLFGGATEMGIAIGNRIPVYVVNHHVRDNIFFHLPEGVTMCESVEDAIYRMVAND